jgi:hypothetical protein
MQMRNLAALLPTLVLAGCISLPIAQSQDPANARIGQSVYVDGPVIKPVAIIEDSRCPAEVQCVWAGRVRIKALWMRADGPRELLLSSDQPMAVADGMMSLTNVRPARPKDGKIDPGEYRFSLSFAGGL